MSLIFNPLVKKGFDETGSGGGSTWGSITGTLSDQTDLQAALDGKQNDTFIVVGPDETYTEIDDAVAALGTDGGKIYVRPGSYAPCTLASNIWLIGDSHKSIINVPNGSQENGILIDSCTNVRVTGMRINGNKANVDTGGTLYLTINGILVTNSSDVVIDGNYCEQAYYGGIAVDESSRVVVRDNRCVSNRDNGIFLRPNNDNVLVQGNIVSLSSFSGIQALRSDYVSIVGNISFSNGPTLAEGDGIGFEGCRYSRIDSNIIYSNGIQGIKVDYTVEGDVTSQRSLNCVISNNTIYNHTDSGNGCGIEVLRSDNTTIRGNRIETAKYGINVGEVVGITIQSNYVANTTSQGIRCHDTGATGKILIESNIVASAGNHGIETFQNRVSFLRNTVSGCTGQGIRVSDGDNTYAQGNTIFDNTDNGIFVSSGAGACDIRHNIFYNTGTAQDRAVYEESGGGPTTMIGNKITGMNTEAFQLNNTSSLYADDQVFNEPGFDKDFRFEGDTATQLLVTDAGLDAVQIGNTVAGEIADFRTTGIVLNESGADRDIRAEGDTDANLVFLDASADRVAIGNNSPSSKLHVGNASTNSMIQTTSITHSFSGGNTLSYVSENTAASGSAAGSGVGLYSNDAAALASGDRLGFFLFGGSSSSSNVRNAAFIGGFTSQAWVDASAYGASIKVETTPNGTTARSQGIEFTSEGGLIVNEQGRDADTRFEGDTETNLFYLDASADRIGIGVATPVSRLHINQANGAGDVALAIQNNATTNGETTTLVFSNTTSFSSHARVRSTRVDGTNHSLSFETMIANTIAERIGIGTTATVINETGIDHDTRIEGDTDANLVFVDASTDRVGIGTSTPAEKLDVVGNIKVRDSVLYTAAPATDLSVSGSIVALTAGESLVFGDVVYVKSDGKMGKGDADAIATSSCIAMAVATIANDATGNFLLLGFARNDAWAWTVGGLIYLSTTAGGMTQTAPSGTDDVIQILGVATHADRMYFKPELVQVEHT